MSNISPSYCRKKTERSRWWNPTLPNFPSTEASVETGPLHFLFALAHEGNYNCNQQVWETQSNALHPCCHKLLICLTPHTRVVFAPPVSLILTDKWMLFCHFPTLGVWGGASVAHCCSTRQQEGMPGEREGHRCSLSTITLLLA